jgi:hypothetical protein
MRRRLSALIEESAEHGTLEMPKPANGRAMNIRPSRGTGVSRKLTIP